MAVGVHLSSHWPLCLWLKLIRYPGTRGHCDIQVSTVYLSQVSLGTHLSTNLFGRMNIWVSCVLTVIGRDQTQASRLVVRYANHCTAVVLMVVVVMVMVMVVVVVYKGDWCCSDCS